MLTAAAPDGSAPPDPDWRTGNLGRLMFSATDALVRHKLRVMREGGVTGVSEAMMALLLNLDREGTRLTDLARRAGQTKQSMIELVDRAAAMRLVERRPDPGDVRAKLVGFTPDGLLALDALEHGVEVAERRFARVVGAPFVAQIERELSAYAGVTTAEARERPAAEPFRRERNVGRLLSLAARRFARDLLAVVHQRGYAEVGEVLLALFRHLDLGGTRLTELAARARVTKQSMLDLVDAGEALGLVERRADPHDRRAKLVGFTPAGLNLLEQVRRGVAVAEADFAAIAGEAFVRALKAKLGGYLVAPSAYAISSAELPSTGWTEASAIANSPG